MLLLNAELRPRIEPAEPLLLSYKLTRTPLTQTRFRRRLLLEPQIDLKRYKVTAEIDWIEVAVVLGGSKTQGRYVHEHLAPLRGYVDGWEGGKKVEGYTGHSFVCRIQNPRYEKVLEFLDRLKMWRGLAPDTEVVGMEVSVDWYPQSQAAEERLKMVGLLRRHFLAPELIDPERLTQRKFAQPRSFVRLDSGKGRGITEFVYQKTVMQRRETESGEEEGDSKPQTAVFIDDSEIYEAEYQSPRIDGTFYVGAESDDVYWRIQDKTTDHRTKASATDLPLSRCRARIEVTLQRQPLRDLGIVSLEDVRNFKFERFAKPYFRFWLATVPMKLSEATADKGLRSAHQKVRRRGYLKDVLCGGVYAALREDCRAALGKRRSNNALLRRERVKEKGRSKKYRLGENGYLVSFDGMNRKTRDALKWLKF